MKTNYAIICTTPSDGTEDGYVNIKHMCLYETEPTNATAESLREELATDEEFGMVGDTDYEMKVISRIDDADMWEMLELPDEIN